MEIMKILSPSESPPDRIDTNTNTLCTGVRTFICKTFSFSGNMLCVSLYEKRM